jgi:hypothetical protein
MPAEIVKCINARDRAIINQWELPVPWHPRECDYGWVPPWLGEVNQRERPSFGHVARLLCGHPFSMHTTSLVRDARAPSEQAVVREAFVIAASSC